MKLRKKDDISYNYPEIIIKNFSLTLSEHVRSFLNAFSQVFELQE